MTTHARPQAAAPSAFDPAGRAQAEREFLAANPAFRETAAVDELRASEYGRLDASGDVYLDYTGGSLYAASQLEEHLRPAAGAVYGNPHSVNPTSSAATVLVERARAAVLRYFSAPEDEYACVFTPNATGALRLVGEAYPFGPRTASWPRSTTTTPSTGSASSRGRRARATAYVPLEAPDLRVADGLLARYLDDAAAGRPQPVRLPRAVELLRRQAPARVDRARPGAGLGRDRGRRRVRADEPARPVGVEAGLRPDLVLQDVRLPDRPRRADRPAPGARATAASLVQRRHRGRRERPGRDGGAAVRPRAVRGRHGQLPRHPGDRDRPAPHRADRHRHDLAPRRGARHVAARGAAAPAALGRQPGDPRLRADDVGSPWRHDRVQLPAPRRPRRSTSASSTSSRRRTTSPSAPAASATRARGRPRSRSRATR